MLQLMQNVFTHDYASVQEGKKVRVVVIRTALCHETASLQLLFHRVEILVKEEGAFFQVIQ